LNAALNPERGFAKTVDEAVRIIRDALRNPSMTYASKLHPHQWKYHGQDTRLVVIVDPVSRAIPTIFVSGHKQ